jgi:RNA polymerase sigma factor (sigma-70 family)
MAVQFRRGPAPLEHAEEPEWADWSTFTEIFRAYAEYVFDYCVSLLHDEGQAADATIVTFISAQALLGKLRNRNRLEAWLYALARRECTSKHPARNEQAPDSMPASWQGADQPEPLSDRGEAGAQGLPRRHPDRSGVNEDDTDQFDAIPRVTDRRQAARQVLSAFSHLSEGDREVLAAFSALDSGDREVLDLVYWHGISAAELPAILDIAPQRAQTLLAGAVRRFRTVAEEIAAAADESGKETKGSGDKLYAAMAVARMPAAVWRRTSRAVFDPDLRDYRNAVLAHVGHLRPDGFPGQPAAPGARSNTLKTATAVALPSAAGIALVVYLAGAASSAAPTTAPPGIGPSATTSSGTTGGSAATHGHKKARRSSLPVTALFPRQPSQGLLPVPTPSGTNPTNPYPSPSTVTSPGPQPSSISPPPSKSTSPSTSPSSASPTPTSGSASPTPTTPTPSSSSSSGSSSPGSSDSPGTSASPGASDSTGAADSPAPSDSPSDSPIASPSPDGGSPGASGGVTLPAATPSPGTSTRVRV